MKKLVRFADYLRDDIRSGALPRAYARARYLERTLRPFQNSDLRRFHGLTVGEFFRVENSDVARIRTLAAKASRQFGRTYRVVRSQTKKHYICRRVKLIDPVKWLRARLGDLPVKASRLESSASALGITARTLQRAAVQIGVVRQHRGFGRDKTTWWSMP